jgi:23S rRNA (cytidine1920-2'-O)/16S rRNA (cytidine1409-2'-O)-methyltransferase
MADRLLSSRLDQTLVERGAFPSRARAQGAIRAGLVRVDGRVIDKPATMVAAAVRIDVAGDVHDYVSRGAVKLEAALTAFEIMPQNAVCLDLGASTGGFTQVLLRAGAAKVYAVDVGAGQLHPSIAGDARVVNLEKTHAKDLSPAIVPDPIDIIVCDVSFIGLAKALPPALALAAPGGRLVALIKPQFELGPRALGKGGIVKATGETLQRLTRDISAWLSEQGWREIGQIDSPIAGGDGNKEFLIGAIKPA